jgi:hypothetical protein
MKFDAEDPSEMSKAKQTNVDRSQGAARAISVSMPTCSAGGIFFMNDSSVLHRSESQLERPRVVQKHHKQYESRVHFEIFVNSTRSVPIVLKGVQCWEVY